MIKYTSSEFVTKIEDTVIYGEHKIKGCCTKAATDNGNGSVTCPECGNKMDVDTGKNSRW